MKNNLPAVRAHSHCALRAQLTPLSVPEARDSIVALRSVWISRFALGLIFFAYT